MQGLLDCLHLFFNLTGILHAISSLAVHITYNWQSTMKLTRSSLRYYEEETEISIYRLQVRLRC